MSIKKLFKSLWPTTIKRYHSPINGLIEIVMSFNKPKMMIGGMIQSGCGVQRIWNDGIKYLSENKAKVKQALIIGLGCGDCAFMLEKFYPGVKMIGVEIDEKVIEAAQCYFNLATIKNLKITINDAEVYVDKLLKQKNKPAFDSIIIDPYLGETMPEKFRTKKFLNQLTKILTHDGVVIYNHLFYGKFKKEAERFIKLIDSSFGKITLKRSGNNLLIYGWF